MNDLMSKTKDLNGKDRHIYFIAKIGGPKFGTVHD